MKFPTLLCGSFLINHEIRIPINQPVFQCNIGGFCFFFRGSVDRQFLLLRL